MSYYNKEESEKRVAAVQAILEKKSLDAALVYFDELNVANGWYLTGWCGQFEKGSVFVPRKGEPWLLGGPESEPFALQSSAVTKIRCFPVFMVPEEEYPNAHIIGFADLYKEIVLWYRANQDRLDSSKLGEYAVAFPHKDRILTIIDSEVY